MKCVICKSTDIKLKSVEEEISVGNDIVLVPMSVLVCQNCGERYYDRKAMWNLEEIRSKLKKRALEVEDVGKVQRAQIV